MKKEQSRVNIRKSGSGYIIEITNTQIDQIYAVTKDEACLILQELLKLKDEKGFNLEAENIRREAREEERLHMKNFFEKKIKIHQHLINTHEILPKEWHEGNINALTDAIKEIYE